MADNETDAETEDEDGAKPKSKKKKLFIIGAGVLVLLLAGGGAFMMMGGEEVIEPPAGAGVAAADDPDKPKEKPVFHELPSLLVNGRVLSAHWTKASAARWRPLHRFVTAELI